MKTLKRVTLSLPIILLLVACQSQPALPLASEVANQPSPDILVQVDSSAVSSQVSPLRIEAFDQDRQVQPDSDEVFELLVANESGQDVPVIFELAHHDGARWRTSLCVGDQCILGDGSDTSVTDPVVLPAFLEQSFQAHLFVEDDVRSGQWTEVTLRVVPQVAGVPAQQTTIRAEAALQ